MLALRLCQLVPCAAAAVSFAPLLLAPPPGTVSPLDLLSPLPWLTQPLAALAAWPGRQFDAPAWLVPLAALLIHLANTLILLHVLDAFLSPRAAALAALLFAVHPLQTETLVLDPARGALLATLFSLLTLSLWLGGRAWAAAAAAFACALLCSPAAAALPALLFLLGRIGPHRRAGRALLATMALLSAVSAGAALWHSALLPRFDFLSCQGVAMLRSLWLLLVPLGLTPDPEVRTGPLAASLAWGAVAAIAALSLSALRRRGALLWILGGLLLLLPSPLSAPGALAADYRMYLPMSCFSAALAIAFERAPVRLLALYAGVLCLLSVSYARLWQNQSALWMEAARLAPLKSGPKRALAPYLPPAQAVELLVEAGRLDPFNPAVATDLGVAFLRAGKPREAMVEFDHALTLDPRHYLALDGRARAWLALDRTDAALADIRQALEIEPCSLDARLVLLRLGEPLPPPGACSWSASQRRGLAHAISGK